MRISDWSSDVCSSDLNIQHHTGWDFAVNAPKSVSIMALVAGDDRIIEAHEQAVSVALAYLEEHATMRHRIDGEVTEKTTGRLIWARFTEPASRELDPHPPTRKNAVSGKSVSGSVVLGGRRDL